MALKIVWTPQAENGLDKVIGYIIYRIQPKKELIEIINFQGTKTDIIKDTSINSIISFQHGLFLYFPTCSLKSPLDFCRVIKILI